MSFVINVHFKSVIISCETRNTAYFFYIRAVLTSTPEQQRVLSELPPSVRVAVPQSTELVTHRHWCVSTVTLHRARRAVSCCCCWTTLKSASLHALSICITSTSCMYVARELQTFDAQQSAATTPTQAGITASIQERDYYYRSCELIHKYSKMQI